MSTTSLYNTTQQTGTVSSVNSTSLYSNTTDFTTGVVNSSVYSVNGGLGVTVNPVTGNVVVSIGQDVATTANVTFANITATGSLSNAYYTLANAAGTNGQVLTTNGAGVTTWTTPSSLGLVSSVTGSGAGISVSPTTGAVIVSNTGVTSAVAGTGIGVSAGTGAVTITNSGVTSVVAGSNISISGATGAVTINSTSASVPSGTGKGQVLFWDGAAWTANSTITFDATTNRLRVVNNASGTNTAIDLLKQYTTTIADGNTVAQLFGFYDPSVALSSTNPRYTHRIRSEYDTANNHIYRIQIDPTGNFQPGSTTTVAQLNLDDDVLSIVGNEFTLNKDLTGAPTQNGIFTVNRGSSTDATLTWNETNDRWEFTNDLQVAGDLAVNGGDITTTQTTASLFNTTATTVNAFGAATAVNIGAATGTTTIEHDLTVNGGNINLNGTATAGVMPFLTFETQAAGANPMYGIRGKSALNDPWFVGSGSVGTDQGYLEIATGDNAGIPGNGGQIYARQYNNGSTPPLGVPWYGGTGVVVNEFILLDDVGDTSIPNNLTVGGDLTVTGTNIDTGVTDTIIQIDKTSSETAIPNRALKLLSTSTGTPTVGFGTALGFQGQTGVSTVKDAAYIAVSSTDITAGSEDFSMLFGLMQNGTTFSNKMELNSSGDLIIDGQFDATRIDIDGQASIDTATITTTSTATVPLTISLTRNAMSGLVNIIQGANVHCLNFTALRVDATTAMLTTYGEMYNNISLGSFTADVSGGSLRLLVTPSSATSTVFSAVRTSLT